MGNNFEEQKFRDFVCRYTSLVRRNFIRFGKRNGAEVGDIINEGKLNKKLKKYIIFIFIYFW